MNRLIKTYFPFIVVVLTMSIVSCDKMDDNYEPFIEKGEVLYTPRALNVETASGFRRIQFNWGVTSNKNISEWVITYGENSTAIVNEGLDVKEKEYILTDVEEGSHEFSLFSKSASGNESVYTKVVAQVYGAEYSASLEPRDIKSISYDGVDGIIKFHSSSPSARLTEIKYVNASDVEVIKTIDRDGLELLLENLSIESSILIRTFYLPTPPIDGVATSLDEIPSEWTPIQLPDFSTIMETITVQPSLGGVTVNWTNADAKEIRVNIEYTFGGELVSKTVTTQVVDGKLIFPLMDAGAQDVVVSIADSFDNRFSKTFNVTPIPAVAINRSGWVVLDKSSERPQNPVKYMFDGLNSTFWHTTPGTAVVYPHHFTIDMGAEKTLSSFWISSRFDVRVATKMKFLVSTDNVNWVNAGTFINPDPTSTAPQYYGLKTLPKARYFKLNLLEGIGKNGTLFQSIIREFNIYGSEN